MSSVIRGVALYLILLVVFRIAGKRALSQITTFDLILLLIISEVVQQAMVANDSSIINAVLLVATLVGLDIGLSLLKQRSQWLSRVVDSAPVLLIENGKLQEQRMKLARVDQAEILSQAREYQGLERLDQIKYAILETTGKITIVPSEQK